MQKPPAGGPTRHRPALWPRPGTQLGPGPARARPRERLLLLPRRRLQPSSCSSSSSCSPVGSRQSAWRSTLPLRRGWGQRGQAAPPCLLWRPPAMLQPTPCRWRRRAVIPTRPCLHLPACCTAAAATSCCWCPMGQMAPWTPQHWRWQSCSRCTRQAAAARAAPATLMPVGGARERAGTWMQHARPARRLHLRSRVPLFAPTSPHPALSRPPGHGD